LGSHYIPQEYLRGFEDQKSPGMIWMYDKKLKTLKLVPIRVAVQEAGFYDGETEEQLNLSVEAPANQVLKRLRQGAQIDDSGRAKVALYIATMMKRVPHRREKNLQLAPEVIERELDRVALEISQLAETTAADPDLVAARLVQVEEIRKECREELPPGVADLIRSPWPSKLMVDAVSGMTWRIISVKGENGILTSDNPAHFFENEGFGRPESELTFPLASDLVLLGSWQGRPGQTLFLQGRPRLVKEVNRRIASGADRFVFYHAEAEWVARLADKPRHLFQRIEW
jgi:hypothetical protein